MNNSKAQLMTTRATLWCAMLLAAFAFAITTTAGVSQAYAQAGDESLQATTLSASAEADSPNVVKHTKAEIVARLKNNPAPLGNPVEYASEPVLNTSAGELSQATKESALAMLNNIRYIAGLNDVTLNDEYGKLAQAGAFVDNAIGKLTHYPMADSDGKPAGMPDSLWSLGNNGAGSSNLAAGYGTLNAAVLGWMSDEDAYNIDRVGHRRWCINPEMAATGFGASGRYYAMYSFDSNGFSSASNVVWPAQTMPVELFADDLPWTLSVGQTITDPTAVRVTLTREADGKTWAFSEISDSTPESTAGAYFNVNNDGYGQPGCIIFRPDNVSYKAGDRFHVSVTGVNGADIAYDVEFITGYPITSLSFPQDRYVLKWSGESVWPTTEPADARGFAITWKSSDSSIVSVDADGRLTAGAQGTATITATVDGAYTLSGEPVSASMQVVVPTEINTDTCKIKFTNLEYTGSAIQPKATIVDKATGKTLKEGVDYTLELADPIVNVGESSYVWVIGEGDYGTSSYRGFYVAVEPREITSGMASISTKSLAYSGKKRTQSVAVTYNGKKLKAGTDYTVTYRNNVNVGKATVTVAGKGNFTGTLSKSFTIAKATNPLQVKGLTAKVSYNKKKASVVKTAAAFKFTKKAAGKVTYTRVAKGSSKYLTINKKTGKVTVKNGAPKQVHVLKVKVTAAGNGNYNAVSKTVTVKVRVK